MRTILPFVTAFFSALVLGCATTDQAEPIDPTLTRITLARFSYPTWIPSSDRILFESQTTGNWEIWTTDFTGLEDGGGNLVRLTDNPALDRMPSISPDGRWIVFISDRDGDYELYRMDADGSNQIQLTFDEVAEIHPYWTPDGKILYNRRETDRLVYDIRIMNADGSDDRTILADGELNSYAQMSPDGRRVVFDKWVDNDETNGEIHLLDLHSGEITRLTNNDVYDGYPTWFPDGERIVYASEVGETMKLFSMRVDGTDRRQLTFGEGTDARPDVSDDGLRIVFNRDSAGTINIEILDLEQ